MEDLSEEQYIFELIAGKVRMLNEFYIDKSEYRDKLMVRSRPESFKEWEEHQLTQNDQKD